MKQSRIGDQTIRFDRDATAAIYDTLRQGDADDCGCINCRNFALQRHLAYPPPFRVLLEDLGIDPEKEGEVFAGGPAKDGYFYGGWFYFVGELMEAGERNSTCAGASQFEFWFTAHCPSAPAFRGQPLVAVEFTTHVDWVLPVTDEPHSQ